MLQEFSHFHPDILKYYVLDSPEKNLRYEGLMVGSSLSEDVKC